MKPLELFFFSTMCYSNVCFAWLAFVHFKVYIQYSFYAQFKALSFLYVWIKSVVENSLQDKELAPFSLFTYSMWTGFFTFCEAVFIYQRIKTPLFISVSDSIKTKRCFSLNILPKPSWHMTKGRHYLKKSAIPSSCSLHEKLQTHCGFSRDKESFVLLSESKNAAHLASCHFSKCGDDWCWEKSGYSWAFASLTICLRHGHLNAKFWRAAKSCQYTCWEYCKFGGETTGHNWSGQWNDSSVWQNRRCWFA